MGVVQKACSSLSCHKLQTLLDTPGFDWAQFWLKCVIKRFIRNGLVDCLTGELIFITGFGLGFLDVIHFQPLRHFQCCIMCILNEILITLMSIVLLFIKDFTYAKVYFLEEDVVGEVVFHSRCPLFEL